MITAIHANDIENTLLVVINAQLYTRYQSRGYFRVLERYQFKTVLCNNGRSLIKSTVDEVILLKRFSDGSKNNLWSLLTLVRMYKLLIIRFFICFT